VNLLFFSIEVVGSRAQHSGRVRRLVADHDTVRFAGSRWLWQCSCVGPPPDAVAGLSLAAIPWRPICPTG
jgi:hypothetical protein